MRVVWGLLGACAVVACSSQSETNYQKAAETDMNADLIPAEPAVTKADAAECDKAKAAAVAARTRYDRDYERRNPGAKSASLSVNELTSCRLSSDGAFVGKWGGARWRFVPKQGGRYVTDPKKVWVGEDEGLDGLTWFSEWRGDVTTPERMEELNRKLKGARKIYG